MTVRYKIIKDIEQDAWNWWDGCNHIGHGVDWKHRIEANVVERIAGKTKDEAFSFLLPHLKDKYDNDESIQRGEDFIRTQYQDKFESACAKLVEISGRPLYRNDFTVYLTTFPRGPYDYGRGIFWLPVLWVNPIANFMHEALHFQFIRYWREDDGSTVSKLSVEDFETLKEALTVVLDESLLPLIEKVDVGYEAHQELRQKLRHYWLENHNFDMLVNYGVELVKN